MLETLLWDANGHRPTGTHTGQNVDPNEFSSCGIANMFFSVIAGTRCVRSGLRRLAASLANAGPITLAINGTRPLKFKAKSKGVMGFARKPTVQNQGILANPTTLVAYPNCELRPVKRRVFYLCDSLSSKTFLESL